MKTRVRHVLLTAGAVLTFLLLAGATYQGVATALERRRFPRPGRLVDVGGHQLHIHCTGQGSPTVVFEAPAAGMSAAWGWVQPRVAEVTRACSYDRAGLGWSEAGDRGYDPRDVPTQLHALLIGAQEPGPYVVAGQGLGAALATLFAARFGDEVAALVLVDPPVARGETPQLDRTMRMMRLSPWLARTGLLRASRTLSRTAAGLPVDAAGPMSTFLNRPDHLTRAAQELARWDEAVTAAGDATLDGRLRVIRMNAVGTGRITFLDDRAAADAATAAILEATRGAAPGTDASLPSPVP
jgi:pimeloyl-ACP methyl ester carboxylesterase